MQKVSVATCAATLLPILLLLCTTTTVHAHNITKILAKHPEFSTFNHYLTATRLAAEINRRQTITVCVVDNAGMADLLSKHLSIYSIKNVLSLHVFVDYFGAKKLHQITDGTATTATMYQATGSAPGTAGFVNITDLPHGKVGFGAQDNGGVLDSFFVKSVEEIPYNISIIQISKTLSSPEAEAPVAPPSLNLTTILNKQGCKSFGDLLASSGALQTFEDNLDGGLTVFCPPDDVLSQFMPRYKNLSKADQQSLGLFHGFPVYNSMQMLKANNGLMNTLATDGAKKFDLTIQNDGEDVTLKTKVVTATISGTIMDEEPLAVYKIDKVLLPRELFKSAPESDAPAPAPKSSKSKTKKKSGSKEAPAPSDEEDAYAPDDDVADQTASDNGAVGLDGGRLGPVVLSVFVAVTLSFLRV
ncbi:FAS1 domain [Dillenia turbinata]|uniref:FAS1 domain n=1 Tax=Dillenia turbinata TaxID=194707 RepID=A0AAN8UZN9_9MAGN